jgi:hypothetical protein
MVRSVINASNWNRSWGLIRYVEEEYVLVVSRIENVILLTLLSFIKGTIFSLSASPIKPYFLSSMFFRPFGNSVLRGRAIED